MESLPNPFLLCDAENASTRVPVALVQPDAEAALANALSFLEDVPSGPPEHKHRRKHNGKASVGKSSQVPHPHQHASAPGAMSASVTPLATSIATAAAAHGTPAPVTWPTASPTSPYRSPEELIQVLQSL
jgi:hypothetical protein